MPDLVRQLEPENAPTEMRRRPKQNSQNQTPAKVGVSAAGLNAGQPPDVS
jgi:hypothetical protein